MKRRRSIIRISVLVVLLGAVGYTFYTNFFSNKQTVLVGRQAMEFSVVDMKGQTYQLSSLKGKGVMLNFFGTWCQPCEQEMPTLNAVYQKYKNKGVEFIAINNDEANLVVKAYMERLGITFPVVIDKDESIFSTYNVGALPTSVFINKDGEITNVSVGALTEDNLTQQLDKTIR